MNTDDARSTDWNNHPRSTFAWMVVLGVHLVAAAYARSVLPHGFQWTHARFWANDVIPLTVFAISVGGLIGLHQKRPAISQFVAVCLVAMYFVTAIGWIYCFPVSGKRPALVACAVGIVLCYLAWRSAFARRRRWGWCGIGVLLGTIIGGLWPYAQQGADPATQPVAAYRKISAPQVHATLLPSLPLGSLGEFSANSAVVALSIDDVAIRVYPLLSFESRSPDRCWTVLARSRDRVSPRRTVLGWTRNDDLFGVYYGGCEPATIQVQQTATPSVRVSAETALAKSVYSHLNTYCRLDIDGHQRLSVSFSPCPQQPIEVTYSQYPVGRPTRLAYVDHEGMFHVVEATSGEKGPFVELARGPLLRDAKLTLTLHDEDKPLCRLTFHDFAQQASTQVSPTAGWGLPENAIEFTLHYESSDAPASLWMTLAGTSVGRGWDSVGHAAGIYSNRIDIESLKAD